MHQHAGPITGCYRSIGEILALGQDPSRSQLISFVSAGEGIAPGEEAGEFRAARLAHRRAAAVYVAAGACHAGIGTVLLFSFEEIEFLPIRTLVSFWVYAWPVLLTLILLWGPNRRRQLLAVFTYFAPLAMICLWVGAFTPATPVVLGGGITVPAYLQPLLFWAIMASGSAFLLVFLLIIQLEAVDRRRLRDRSRCLRSFGRIHGRGARNHGKVAPHRSLRAMDRRQMQHGEEPPLSAALYRRGPSVSVERGRVGRLGGRHAPRLPIPSCSRMSRGQVRFARTWLCPPASSRRPRGAERLRS
jgi:hypothetical protein